LEDVEELDERKESNYVCLTPDDILREQQQEINKISELFEVKRILQLGGFILFWNLGLIFKTAVWLNQFSKFKLDRLFNLIIVAFYFL
jgi:hypothetical protein